MLAKHPFLVGFVVMVLLSLILNSLPSDSLSPGMARLITIGVCAVVLIVLFQQGLERDDVFWFLLGGLSGLLVTFFATM